MEERRFVETTYQGMTVREQKMLPALQHLVHRQHEFSPSKCDGCLEAAAFLRYRVTAAAVTLSRGRHNEAPGPLLGGNFAATFLQCAA